MTMNPLPPQAYTKETLTKAYMWLAHQNASIKELATTPDILVSLFLKAQRNGTEALDAPSIQNFKNELKSLAGLMGELENKNTTVMTPVQPSPPVPPPVQTQMSFQTRQMSFQQQPQLPQQPYHPVAVDPLSQLDARSRGMISEVREQLNLSNDVEVLRLLISLGYQKAKNL